MLKASRVFFPPTLAHKVWYNPFTVTRVCKSSLVVTVAEREKVVWMDHYNKL